MVTTSGSGERRLGHAALVVLLCALTGFVAMHVIALTDVATAQHHVPGAIAVEPGPAEAGAAGGSQQGGSHGDGHLVLVGCLVALTGLAGWLLLTRSDCGRLLSDWSRTWASRGHRVVLEVPSGVPRGHVQLSLCVVRI